MSKSVLVRSSYKPGRGGQAPGDLRDAFLEAVEAYATWEDVEPEPCVEVRGQAVTLTRLCGLLWNCTDTMPRLDQEQLEDCLPRRFWGDDRSRTCSSYGRAARAMRGAIEGAAA